MFNLIALPIEDDRLAALKIFIKEGEVYHCIPGNRFYVTARAVKALQEAGIKFEFVGKKSLTS